MFLKHEGGGAKFSNNVMGICEEGGGGRFIFHLSILANPPPPPAINNERSLIGLSEYPTVLLIVPDICAR